LETMGVFDWLKTPTTPRPRILWLVLAHIVVGLTGAFVAYPLRGPTLRGPAFVGIVFSQTSLLGIWGGLGTNPWWSRLIGVVVGVGSLGLLLGVGVDELAWENYFIVSVGTALITGVLLVVRCFRVCICVATVEQAAAYRMQFTIRQLLVLTFAVACLVSLGKWLAPHLMNVTEPLLLTLIGLVFATVGLLSVWPALGARHPVLPSLIVIVVAAGVGFCFAQLTPMSGMASLWMTVTSIEALVLVPSLLVVRSCGYRLMRLPSRRVGVHPNRQDQSANEEKSRIDAG
jgi:ABC-type multidrug transport system fused ATPase/permease subunit